MRILATIISCFLLASPAEATLEELCQPLATIYTTIVSDMLERIKSNKPSILELKFEEVALICTATKKGVTVTSRLSAKVQLNNLPLAFLPVLLAKPTLICVEGIITAEIEPDKENGFKFVGEPTAVLINSSMCE